jgi:hypothetical protein
MTSAVTTTDPKDARVAVGWNERGVQIDSLDAAYRFAVAVVKSGLVPDGLRTPEAVMVALQAGLELGLTPWQSIQSIVPIKGTPTIRVETARALVEAAGLLEPGGKIRHRFEGDGDNLKCVVWALPRGAREPVEGEFSMADAKTAGLAGKDNWRTYPKRMLLARATGFLIRDYFPTAIRRVPFAEEVADIEDRRGRTERDVTPPATSAPRVSSLLAAKIGAAPVAEAAACAHRGGFAIDQETGESVCTHCGEREAGE